MKLKNKSSKVVIKYDIFRHKSCIAISDMCDSKTGQKIEIFNARAIEIQTLWHALKLKLRFELLNFEITIVHL